MTTEVAEKLIDVAMQVEIILRSDQATRNDDTLLVWRVWQRFHGVEDSVTLQMMMDVLPNFETIRRTRAKIQNDLGKHLPTDAVVRRRRGLEEDWRNAVAQLDLFEGGIK